jgi:hypothetical protein
LEKNVMLSSETGTNIHNSVVPELSKNILINEEYLSPEFKPQSHPKKKNEEYL